MFSTGKLGILISIFTFVGISIFVYFKKISKKRMLSYIASYILFVIFAIVCSIIFGYDLFNVNNLNFGISNFTNFTNIFNNYMINFNYISNFNFGKNIIEFIYNLFSAGIFNISIVLLFISLIENALLCILSKEHKCFLLINLPLIVNLFMGSTIQVAFCNFIFMSFSLILLCIYLFRKIYKNEKFKMK